MVNNEIITKKGMKAIGLTILTFIFSFLISGVIFLIVKVFPLIEIFGIFVIAIITNLLWDVFTN